MAQETATQKMGGLSPGLFGSRRISFVCHLLNYVSDLLNLGKSIKTGRGCRRCSSVGEVLPWHAEKPRTPSPAPHKLGVLHACNLNIHRVQARESRLSGDFYLCIEVYFQKPWLKMVRQTVCIPRMKANETMDTPILGME